MRCPFLREAQVKYCQGSPIKKMIARMPGESANEKCSSKEYVHCPSLKQHREEHPQQTRCPFLQESLVQYCSASSVTKYVPYSESSIIRCGNDGHRYCDLFLSVSAPNNGGGTNDGDQQQDVDGIHLPAGLAFSSNHMWLDQGDDGMCHIGVDEFLTRIFQRIDAINFLPSSISKLPTIVLTMNGVDVQLVFPIPVDVARVNSYLRADVQKLISHPYSAGWCYEGMLSEPHSSESKEPASRIMRGDEALQWMRGEVHHLTEFIQDQIIPNQAAGQPVMMDGGVVHPDFINHLQRQDLLNLFNEFFSPYAHWRKTE